MRKQVLSAFVIVALPGVCQQSVLHAQKTTPPPNAWLNSATQNPLSPDPFNTDIRAARDSYFDSHFGWIAPIRFDAQQSFHLSRPKAHTDSSAAPELPPALDRAIIVGQFRAFESVLSRSNRSIYTEIAFTTDRVLEDASGQLTTGNFVTVVIPGGTVTTQQGSASYLTDPEELFVQPDHRYLLVLSRNPEGQFYALVKSWEIVNGMVQPNSAIEKLRARSGHASLAGLREDAVKAAIEKLENAGQGAYILSPVRVPPPLGLPQHK